MKIYFDNDKETLQYYGCNSYPYNFEALRELLGFEEDFDEEIEWAVNQEPEEDDDSICE